MKKIKVFAILSFFILPFLLKTSCQQSEEPENIANKVKTNQTNILDGSFEAPAYSEPQDEFINEVPTQDFHKGPLVNNFIKPPNELPEIYRTLEDSNSSYFANEIRITLALVKLVSQYHCQQFNAQKFFAIVSI